MSVGEAPRGAVIARSLTGARPGSLAEEEVDVLVVGSGIAGLTVATSLGAGHTVAVMAKSELGFGSTLYAQGGVAASVAADDTPSLHFQDTLVAGAGLCDADAVRVLVEEAPDAVAFLEASGVRLDLEGLALAVTREGGHSRRRVVHAGGDATGAEIVRALLEQVRRADVRIVEGGFLVDVLTDADGTVAGALVLVGGDLRVLRCGTVVLASGGFGQLYAETTAPRSCTGDGAAAALRAGAELGDLEFVQFHPTTLFVPDDPRPLLSEAMRGEGARLVDRDGRPVMEGVHPLGDLAPRDVVSQAVFSAMRAEKVDHLYLDATGLGEPHLLARFPTILAACRAHGIDPVEVPIPISPACHYTMGGVRTDLDGRTSIDGLYAVGEVASSGVHGANRLASNSLLEGAVFGRRAARAITAAPRRAGEPIDLDGPSGSGLEPATRSWLRGEMVRRAGVLRDREGLGSLLGELHGLGSALGRLGDESALEEANLLTIATALVGAALRREETRGAHARGDFPEQSVAWQHHQVVARAATGQLEFSSRPVTVDGPAPLAATRDGQELLRRSPEPSQVQAVQQH